MSQPWEIENFLEIKNNRLYIDGVSAVELAEEHGTPLFVFSENRIRHNVSRIRSAAQMIGCPVKICYAAKALSTMAILGAVKVAGCDIEVNSGGELWKALEIGFVGEQIIFNGTSKEIWELEAAIDAEIYAVQVDSLLELALIEDVARRRGKRANVSLRLVPEIDSSTHSGLRTALLTSKFGMMPDEARTAFRQYKNSPHVRLAGVHLHIGSQNPSADAYAEALQILFRNLTAIYGETGVQLTHVNLGGGFPVNYLRDRSNADSLADGQREMFSAEFDPADAIREAWDSVGGSAEFVNASALLNEITLLVEPGRSIIADAGVCLTSVRNIKQRPTEKGAVDHWLLTDAGFNLLPSMATYNWYYHLVSAERSDAPHDFAYKVAGPLCDGGDVYFDVEGRGRLPEHRRLPANVRLGEVLAVLTCGAYSLAQASQYNGRFLPPVVLITQENQPKLVRRRDSFRDLVAGDIF